MRPPSAESGQREHGIMGARILPNSSSRPREAANPGRRDPPHFPIFGGGRFHPRTQVLGPPATASSGTWAVERHIAPLVRGVPPAESDERKV